jgi:cytochrome c
MKSLILGLACFGLLTGTAFADGDAAKGEKAFKACMACHSFTGKTNKVGPYLKGIVGRAASTAEGYNYSEPMKAYGATGAVWDEATLDKYLESPKATVPGTKMTFAGVKKPDQRADLIAFLKTKM